MMKIQAWVHREVAAPPRLETLGLDEPRPDEVLVRLEACGVCHTDLFAPQRFALPAVFGHEGAGVVERTGAAVRKLKPGDRVVLTFGSCGGCRNCLAGAPAYCMTGHELQFGGARADGSPTLVAEPGPVHGAFFQQSSFATHALASERNAVRVPDELPLDLAAPLGCGIQTGAGAVFNTLACAPGASLAVFGVGSVGLAAVMAARLARCEPVIAVDLRRERLELALELGASHAIDARSDDVVGEIRDLTDGGARYSVETAGDEKSFREAIDCLARLGTCGLCTVPRLGAPIEFSPLSVLKGRTVTGVIEGSSVPDEFIPRLARLHLDGELPYDRLVSFYDFADLPLALADAEAGRAIKAVIRT